MSEKIFTKKEKPQELILAKQFIDECKFDEADQLIRSFEEKGGHTLHDIVLCHLLKCELLFWRGLFEEVVKLAEQTHKESLRLGKNILSVDILLIMAWALLWLYQTDKSHDIIKQGEELLKGLTQELPSEYKKREALIAFLKGWVYHQKSDADQAIKHFEHSLSLREELGVKKEIAFSLSAIAQGFMLKGEVDQAFNYSERGLTVAEESGNKFRIGYCLHIMAGVHIYKGELDRSIKLNERSLTIYNDLNHKLMVARILNSLGGSYAKIGELDRSIRLYEQGLELFKGFNNKIIMAFVLNGLSDSYRMRGELDRALECIEQSMALSRELGALRNLAINHDYLIQILIDKGDLERARISLRDLEQLNSQLKDKQINSMYLFDKALVLKTSSRALNRGKAEEILKRLLEEEDLDYELTIGVLFNLCDLLLTELRMTNDLEVLDELTRFIGQLLEIAEESHSYLILCETYLIQAKLSLLTFNIKKAQRFLTQAHQIAERFDLTQLIAKIANEKEDLDKKLDLWEKLKEEDAPMSDRMELARLDEKIVKMIQKRPLLTGQVSVEKIAISKEKKICLVCRGDVFGFSYACKCGANYCETCARALTNLENVCWACEEPIDYSKPVKKFKEEERAKVEETAKKK